MAALGQHANVKVFSEKLLLLLNRGGEAQGCAAPRPCPGTRVLGPQILGPVSGDPVSWDPMTPVSPQGDSGPNTRTT